MRWVAFAKALNGRDGKEKVSQSSRMQDDDCSS
jgi:hypothetical protein